MFTFEDGTCTAPPESLCIYDALVIKYDPRLGLSHLVAHADFGLVAATVQLNDGFEGGGTWYQCLESEEEGAGNAVGAGDGLRTGKGHVTVHAGPLWHAGAHTTGYAPRYIMTIFFLSDRHVDANRRIQNRVINALRVAEMYGESSPNPDEEKVGRAAEAAEALLGCSLKLHPLDAESHADLVPAYRRLNNLEMAVEAGRTACSIGMLTNRSRNFGTWFQLGESLVALAEQVKERGNNSPVSIMETNRLLTEAVATYREVLRLYDVQPLAATGGPSFRSSALGGLGGALRRRALSDEDTIEAGLVLEEATMVDPENVAAWSELGLLMEMAGGEAAEQAAKVCKSQVIMIGMKKRQEAEARAKQMTDKKK
uniref:Fe2OG dioxygenase domain-containing protein n=1 Tax=Corethron hystrix TaxID=216773 RepID=A0A7S1FYC9_9STRA